MIAPESFRFLNVERPLDWHSAEYPRLWMYYLHYFDDLVAVDAFDRTEWHETLIRRWIVENPVAEGVGWEPYPTSRRIANWIKWLLLGHQPVAGMLSSIAQQAEFVSRRLEYHLMANHLIANIKALILASLVLDCDKSQIWLDKARRLLTEQLREQIFNDGGHYERSPMYHAVVLEDIMDIVNIGQSYQSGVEDDLRNVAAIMAGWLQQLSRTDGTPSYFNDSVAGMAPCLAELKDYGMRLHIESDPRPLSDSRFAVLENDRIRIIVDTGSPEPSYQPGHAHAEALAIELEVGGRSVLVNRGISTYETGATRLAERSTMAHNTVTMDGHNSSDVWGGFRVARRANIISHSNDSQLGIVRAAHDGFSWLPGPVTHDREVRLLPDGIRVIDRLSGDGRHQALSYWHLHPDCRIESDEHIHAGELLISMASDSEAVRVLLTFDGQKEVRLEEFLWNRTFGESLAAHVLVCEVEDVVPFQVTFSARTV